MLIRNPDPNNMTVTIPVGADKRVIVEVVDADNWHPLKREVIAAIDTLLTPEMLNKYNTAQGSDIGTMRLDFFRQLYAKLDNPQTETPDSQTDTFQANLTIDREDLTCPHCEMVHKDIDHWAFRPHTTHLCLGCGELFDGTRPAVSNPTLNPKFLNKFASVTLEGLPPEDG